jgi:predicted acyl esterase
MAFIRGKEVKETAKQEPANPKLWNTITAQAGAKFSKNSPARGHWIHAKYNQMGGQYVKSKKEVDPRFRDYAQEEADKKEEQKKKKVTKPVNKKVIKRGQSFR